MKWGRRKNGSSLARGGRLIKAAKWGVVSIFAVFSLALVAKPVGSGVMHLFGFDRVIEENANNMLSEGRNTFRFDTFGDEHFWGDQLMLHQAIEGAALGGVGPGVSP